MNGTRENQKSESAQSVSLHTSISQENLTQEKVRELFDYQDGDLVWRVSLGKAKKGNKAGCESNGYIVTSIGRRPFRNHRIIWLWHHGYIPEGFLDHIDRNPKNNRIENLREVSNSCNQRNSIQRPSFSGVKGVCWDKSNGMWLAYIKINMVLVNLGRHATLLEAACHRLTAEQFEGWMGCESTSPAYLCVKRHIAHLGT